MLRLPCGLPVCGTFAEAHKGMRALALGCTTATPPGLGRRVKEKARQLLSGPVNQATSGVYRYNLLIVEWLTP